jgi:uncharacterized membrane protein
LNSFKKLGGFFMLIRTLFLGISMIFPVSQVFSLNKTALSSESVSLYTPYTKISVPPGESIDYTIDLKNKGSETKNVNVYIAAMPNGWNYSLKSGGWNISQLSILPGEQKSLSLSLAVPVKVNKGNYRFKVVAEGFDELVLTVNVSEQGTFKTEFTSDQANMEGNSKSTFTFRTKLKNQTGEKQLYSLRADVPRGWNVIFKPDYNQATSVEIEPNITKEISIDVKPPEYIEAGTYKIPVSAITNLTSASLELEVVVTGSYSMELTTPMGLLSANITAGDNKRVELLIQNTGSAELKDIKLSATKPVNWDVVFDPVKVDRIEAGKNAQVFATIKADKKAIAGDYATTITASTPEISSQAAFRISVKTPMFWGWIGILIILVALGSVYYLFRKYGRR